MGTSFPARSRPTGPRRAGAPDRDLLEAAKERGRKLDRAAMEAIQLERPLPSSRPRWGRSPRYLPPAWGARFRGWDGRADAASARFLVARAFRRKLGDRVLAAWRVPLQIGLSETRLLDLARADDAAFGARGSGRRRGS